MRRLSILLLTAALLAFAGCGGGDDDKSKTPDPADEPSDAAAKPPAGYHTVKNNISGFTVSVPDSWKDKSRNALTQIDSDNELVVVTIAADRSDKGRDLTAKEYATATLKTLRTLKTDGSVKTLKGSPYENAYVEATGKIPGEKDEQDLRAVIFRRPGKVTYGLLVFSNAKEKSAANDKAVEKLLDSFRAQAPDATP